MVGVVVGGGEGVVGVRVGVWVSGTGVAVDVFVVVPVGVFVRVAVGVLVGVSVGVGVPDTRVTSGVKSLQRSFGWLP